MGVGDNKRRVRAGRMNESNKRRVGTNKQSGSVVRRNRLSSDKGIKQSSRKAANEGANEQDLKSKLLLKGLQGEKPAGLFVRTRDAYVVALTDEVRRL